MFKKLKLKFIIINMSMLISVFIIIFLVIYILTAALGERQLIFDMEKLMNMPPKPRPDDHITATSLIVNLDKNNNIINTFSFMTIEQQTIEQAVTNALESKKNRGSIYAGDFNYSFLKRETMQGTKIVFVDRGPLKQTLLSLLGIFLLTGIISLVLLFLVSLQLANRTIKPIKEAFDKQQQFIADASHELKTPLTIIKTNLAVIKANEEQTVKSQAKWLGFIYSQTDRMTRLVNDMLSLAKIDSSKQKLTFEKFNLSRSIEGVLLLFEAAIFENGICLEKKLEPNILFYGNKEGIERIVNILMDNAIKNTPKKGIISVYLSKTKSNIKIIVKNTGSGIPRADINKIFERFYRADQSRTRESGGYGLGLAIAKAIVEHHHGKIYAKSNVGIDASFIVELPYNKTALFQSAQLK